MVRTETLTFTREEWIQITDVVQLMEMQLKKERIIDFAEEVDIWRRDVELSDGTTDRNVLFVQIRADKYNYVCPIWNVVVEK